MAVPAAGRLALRKPGQSMVACPAGRRGRRRLEEGVSLPPRRLTTPVAANAAMPALPAPAARFNPSPGLRSWNCHWPPSATSGRTGRRAQPASCRAARCLQIPTGFCLPAQGWRPSAYLGSSSYQPHQPQRGCGHALRLCLASPPASHASRNACKFPASEAPESSARGAASL
jgi:hypothetical protein